MASLFGFRTRSPDRDRDTDRERHMRLDGVMQEIALQMLAERTGLERRYRESSANAGFLVDAMDNDEAASGSSARLDAMTDDLINCERRLAALSRQMALMEDLRRQAQDLVEEDRQAPPAKRKAKGAV
ncbi:hypothetical protein [Chelativorans sp. AA-79]|uniref:hypothetical protein n=1 Tax=Chelativorans sp. AA-79 TaxID=3028735 RepID=UPI0023F75E55|nr:hypothetical protein [Chelativorans sp. AA-79]WEX08168.1 hypothetical protein PVE73_19065 [Chelativorans sp. AA-79]